MSDGFHTLWDNGGERVPALFLNSTVVESGKRAIAGNLKIDAATFNDAIEVLGVVKAEMRLSSAVHNSARFTYVSPAGTVKPADGDIWGHLVDGGYFDNSGGSTAVEILNAMLKATNPARLKEMVPVVIMITNDPKLNDTTAPMPYRFMNEVLSPIRTFFNTRPARASYSRSALLNWTEQNQGVYIPIGLQNVTGPLPMSWVLSDVAKKTMQHHLDRICTRVPGERNGPVVVNDLLLLKSEKK